VEEHLRALAAMAGNLAIGTVQGVEYDAEGVLVRVTLAAGGEDVTCRRMLGYGGATSGDGYGDFWEPDVDQEVLVALLGGDPNAAILLGPLQTLKSPTPAGVGPGKRVIVVRHGDSVEVHATGDVSVTTTGTVRVEGAAAVKLANSDAPLAYVDGVVTGACMCQWGGMHTDHSAGVLAEKTPPPVGRG
jgi:phage baseplate assembly protein gpV